MEMEEVLSKGISLCDRYRLLDVKYDMTHLLARVLHAANQRAGTRYLDSVLEDVEVYQHMPYLYALRFLRASLSLQSPQPQEGALAINQVRLIASAASSRGDHAISAMASAMEALVHISRTHTQESIEQAQRALASARGSQLYPASQDVPQLALMIHFVDLSCSIYQADTPQTLQKMNAMHECLDRSSNSRAWSKDGCFGLPMSFTSAQTLQFTGSQGGIVEREQDGRVNVRLKWLARDEAYALGSMLSAIVLHHKNAFDEKHRAEEFINEAQSMMHAS